MAHEFPIMLYKHGSAFKWDDVMVDYLVIEAGEDADDELKAALKDGWSVGKPEAKKSPAKADEEDDEAKAALKSLREEYKKVAGKAAFNGWDADTLKAKIAEHA